MLRLYDHFKPYVADTMIMVSCTFIDASCLEVHALTKRVATKSDAKLWPYYVRSLSGISGFYAYACFPKRDHPDIVDYVQAIPEILIFTHFLNDVLRQVPVRFWVFYDIYQFHATFSFYKEAMDREQHNYCQMMSRVSGDHPVKVLQDVADETVAVAKRVTVILKDAPAALKAFKEYEQG
ncbi:hypothetical protein B0H14DRAFT_3446497 [Mycena olivaceomarginata]|nr:hypothetical protein B0H14DRAFT_3446497 [Mycena olivaceomarginata]